MTAALSFPQVRSLAAGMLTLVVACSLLSFATPRAQANSPAPVSGLTDTQVSAIISLLQSFGADGATVTRVQIALNGGVVPPVTGSVNLKVAGLDGPISINANTIASVSWNTTGVTNCTLSDSATRGIAVQTSGTVGVRVNSSRVFTLACTNSTGTSVSDSVNVTTLGTPFGPTCTYASNGMIGTDDLNAGSSMTGTQCQSQCTIVRNEKYGANDSGVCTFTNTNGVSQSYAIPAGTGSSAGITVTAPNGGERWEIGQLNTVTWSPYSYTPTEQNPAREVSVYLEKKVGSSFVTVGQVMDQGKASLHTYFNIDAYDKWAEAGQYYVRVLNTRTGATDRSNEAFTLLPRAIDIRVNGSDSSVALKDNQPITVSAKAGINLKNCSISGARPKVGGDSSFVVGNLNQGSTVNWSVYAYAPTPGSYTSVYMVCNVADGSSRSDSVQVEMRGSISAALKVVSPNGGEQINRDQKMTIQAAATGVSVYSLALYKNDQWKTWLVKDATVDSSSSNGSIAHSIIPSSVLQGLGEGDNAGAVYKIYITGQKADGTGYVDDKSDAAFSFISPGTSTTTSTKATYQGFIDGNLFITTKDITRADALANCKQNASANPGRNFRCVWGGEEIYATATTYTTNATASLTASPASGAVPLTVNFKGSGGGRAAFGGARVDFGDGSTSAVCDPGRSCGEFTISHVYAYAGNYTVRLISVGEGTNVTITQTNIAVTSTQTPLPCTAGSSSCPTVSPITAASLSASPASGAAPLTVNFKGSGGGRAAFGGARVDFGDGSTSAVCDPGRSCGTFTLSHTYTVAGKYIARLIMVGEGSVITLAQTNVKVTNPSTTSTTSVPVPSSAGAFRTDGPMAFMAAAAAVPFTLAVDMLSSIFYWTGFY